MSEREDLAGLEELTSEHRGVRIWSVQGPSQQALIDRIAVILGEHMADGDELHITYAVVQNGSEDRTKFRFLREPDVWTELFFEYSALLILRGPPPPLPE